jgi:hypothetical protein
MQSGARIFLLRARFWRTHISWKSEIEPKIGSASLAALVLKFKNRPNETICVQAARLALSLSRPRTSASRLRLRTVVRT